MTLQRVATRDGFDFYKGIDSNDREVFNVVPERSAAPVGGVYNSYTVCNANRVLNIFKYLKS